jgi:hypothetical protein
MLLSYRYNFLFLANHKCASTSIEQMLRPFSEFAIVSTALGKHLNYREVCRNIQFAFTRKPLNEYFRFGVIRDPVEKEISWFNYRHGKLSPLPTKDHALDLFHRRLRESSRRLGKAKPFGQTGFFSDASGHLGVDYLIPFPKLATDLARLRTAFGLPAAEQTGETVKNSSKKVLSSADISEELRGELEELFSHDKELFNKSVNGWFGSPEEAVYTKNIRR